MRHGRILLLAMSGVRVHDPALLEVGLTLPGFVERSRVIAALPSLGLCTIAAHTPPGWELAYREVDDLDEAARSEILCGGWDVVAISSLSARILETYALADELRASGVRVVLGGLHVSALPDEAALHADAVVRGEGEAVWPLLLDDLARGELRRLYDARDPRAPPFDFASARVPRWGLLGARRYDRLTVQTTRGCPLDCTFCAASRTISPYRRKSIPQVRREIAAARRVWPRPFLELADDNTFVHKPWSRQLAAALGEEQLSWFTETDVSVADDDELLGLLRDGGCAQLLIGLESATRRSLATLDGRGYKHASFPEYVERVQKVQSYGIPVNGCFVIGFDEDGPEVFERTRDFVRASGLAEVQVTVLTPFPGTALHRRLEAEGRLLTDVYWERCTLFDVAFRPARMTADELARGFRELMVELYSAEETSRRRAIFRECTKSRLRAARAAPLAGLAGEGT